MARGFPIWIGLQGEILYAPPPSFLARRHFSVEGGGGGVYFEAPCGRNFIRPPSFIRPPTPRRVFSGVWGGGCIKNWPCMDSSSILDLSVLVWSGTLMVFCSNGVFEIWLSLKGCGKGGWGRVGEGLGKEGPGRGGEGLGKGWGEGGGVGREEITKHKCLGDCPGTEGLSKSTLHALRGSSLMGEKPQNAKFPLKSWDSLCSAVFFTTYLLSLSLSLSRSFCFLSLSLSPPQWRACACKVEPRTWQGIVRAAMSTGNFEQVGFPLLRNLKWRTSS